MQKAFFYNDPFFIDRLKLVSPSLKELGEKIPTITIQQVKYGSLKASNEKSGVIRFFVLYLLFY